MTELSQQINKIRSQNLLSVTPLSQGRPSLFLSAKEAAGVDIEQVHDAAVNGLKVLSQYDGRLSAFLDGILHSSSMTVQRELKTADENQCLDKEISILLEHLSLFAAEPSTHLVLEYLIRRYRVNEFNCDALLRCLISTHDTKIFARAVQLCTISGTVWAFLEGVKNSGSPLPRSVIISRCIRDTALLSTICQVSRSALGLVSADGIKKPKSAVIAGADRILSFLTATIIELADKGSMNDAQLRILYPFLVEGLKKSTEGSDGSKSNGSKVVFRAGGPVDQWRRSSCMIIAQICRKTKLAKPLLKTLIGSLMSAFMCISGVTNGVTSATNSRSADSAIDAAVEVITVVAIVSQNQKVTMGPKMLMAVFSDISVSSNSSIEFSDVADSSTPAARVGSAYILQCIEILQKEKGFDTTALFKVLTTTLTAALVTNIAEEMKNDPRYLSPMMASKILAYCITSGLLSESIIGSIVWTILQNNSLLGHLGTGILSSPPVTANARRPRAESFSDDNDGDRKEVLRVLRCVSQRYPSVFDSCVKAAYDAVSATKDIKDVDVPETDADKMVVVAADEDDKDDEDAMQVGPTLAEMNLEKVAKANLLRQLLSDTFTDAPYRMPSDTGVSLMLSLSSSSPVLRVQALQTFAVTLPDVCESTPDVQGLAQAASLSLTDYDPSVALAAWDVAVVSRIAAHISPKDLLEATVNAYNWWADSKERVPIRACKILSVILATLAEASVASSICKAQTSAFGAVVDGSVWLFATIIKCAIEENTSESAAAVGGNVDQAAVPVGRKSRLLPATALRCARLLSEGGLLALFSESGTSTEDAQPLEALSAMVAKSLSGGEVKVRFEALHSASQSFLLDSSPSKSNKLYARSFILFLDSISRHLESMVQGKEKGKGQRDSTYGLQLCCTVSASAISRYIKISESSSSDVCEAVIASLQSLIQRCKICDFSRVGTAQNQAHSITDLIAAASTSISAADIGGRLILSILGSEDSAVAALVGSCLGVFYSHDPLSVLYRISLSTHSSSAVPADDVRMYSPLQSDGAITGQCGADMSRLSLQVTPHARASAITAIAQFVSALNLRNTGDNVSASQSTALIAIAPIAIGACCDENALLRSAGVSLAKALSTLRPALQLHVSSSSKFSENGAKEIAVPMTMTELILLGEILSGASALILNDPLAVPAVLAKKVFAEPLSGSVTSGIKKGTRSKILSESLLALSTLYGWGTPFVSIPIITAASAAPLNSIWKYLQILLMRKCGRDDASQLLSNAVLRCLSTVHEANSEIKKEIVTSFCELITVSGNEDTHITNDVLKTLGDGWAMELSNADRSELFTALLKEQIRQSGREEILQALRCIPIDLSTAAVLVEEGSATFLSAYKQSSPTPVVEASSLASTIVRAFEIGQLHGFDEDDSENTFQPSGMSQALQRFCSIIEGLHTVLSAGRVMEEVDAAYMRTIVASLLNAFQCLNQRKLKALLSVEYAKTIVADAAHSCLTAASSSDVTALFAATKKGKKVKKDKEKAKEMDVTFDQERAARDVNQVLLCLGSARSLQLQKSSLRLLRDLIALCPDSITISVEVLGSLLASPSISAHLLSEAQDGSNGLVNEILSTLVTAMPDRVGDGIEEEEARGVKFLPQDILQPLCTRFLSVPSSSRSSLLRAALRVLGPCALPASTSVLLAHALSAYDPEGEVPTPTQGGEGPQGGLILLSRSSQRKASRLLKSSQPEELFRLAMDSILTQSGEVQVGTLVALVKSVQQLLKSAASSILQEESEPDSTETEELILVEIDNVGEMLLDVGKIQDYCESITTTNRAERAEARKGDTQANPVVVEKKGTAAAFLLLQLEFVFEVLENKTFHRQLLPLIEAEGGSDTLQSFFLELSEQVLQLLALSTRSQASAPSSETDKDKKKHVHSFLSVQLGDSKIDITVDSLGKSVGAWCLDILKATQKVLDAPSFVAILQELLSHEDPSVRQTALQILSKRLMAMSQGKRPGAEERALFLDLTSHLRAAVRGCLAPVSSSDDAEGEKGDTEQDRLGIAQSALMCLDILAKYLGSSPNWTTTLADTLQETVGFSTQVASSIEAAYLLLSSSASPEVLTTATPSKSKKSKNERAGPVVEIVSASAIAAAKNSYPELLKLQGSVFLSSGTICGTVGPRSLPYLAELLSNILSCIEAQGVNLIADERHRARAIAAERAVLQREARAEEAERAGTDAMDQEEEPSPVQDSTSGESHYTYPTHRSRLLLLRSSVAAVTTIISELPSFFHPYILRSLSATLVLRGVGSSTKKDDSEIKKNQNSIESSKPKFQNQKKKIPVVSRNEKRQSKEDVAQQANEAHSAETKALCEDIDRLVSVMSSAIPPRLSVPILLQGAPSIFAMGHGVAAKFAALLGKVWGNLDRSTVVQHIAQLSSLAILALDYRRLYGDQSTSSDEVDLAVSDAVVQLCLKLTENELKALLARMAEWRDFERLSTSSEGDVSPEEVGAWQRHSRGVSFYHLIAQLSGRLRSIFLPSMGLIWTNAVSSLQALAQHSNDVTRVLSDIMLLGDIHTSSKSKKRKSAEVEAAGEGEGEENQSAVSQRAVFSELVLRSEHVLSSVKSACVHDSEGFIDETRYSLMMPATADLIALRDAFSCDTDYLLFIERHVCSSLSALARAVGRDVLWKPLNHRVLLLTRDSRKVVRIAALKTLHKLFIEVGEEYLLLLPECLPFLSELLEDDATDVTAQTGELVRYIEELSGEKLDAYLQ